MLQTLLCITDTEETVPPLPSAALESSDAETPKPPPLPPLPPPLPPNSPPPLPLVSPPPLPPRESDEPLPPGVDTSEEYYSTRPPLPPVPPPPSVPPPPPESPPPPPPPPVSEQAMEMDVANTYQMSYAVAPIPMQYDPYHMHAVSNLMNKNAYFYFYRN